MKTVLIIGGGASGMAAALSAATSPDNRVVLLERQARVGRKLLSTGNGRCNLTNMFCSPAKYHGEEASFVMPALSAYPPEKILGIEGEQLDPAPKTTLTRSDNYYPEF